MRRRRFGFTLIELLVVIAIIALLMSILMPSLSRVRKQSKTIMCIMNLKQWCNIHAIYTGENDGYFYGDHVGKYSWLNVFRKYYSEQPKIRFCPEATKTGAEGGKFPFSAWGPYRPYPDWDPEVDDDAGSYGDGYSPRIASVYNVNQNLKFSAIIAQTFKSLALSDIAGIESSGKKLDYKYEEGWSADIGFEINVLKNNLNFGVVYFESELDNLVKWNFDPITYDVIDIKQISKTHSTGLESFVNFRQGILFHELNYMYIDAAIKEDANSKYIRANYVPHHNFTYILNAKLTDDLMGVLKFRSVSEQEWSAWGFDSRISDYCTTDIILNYTSNNKKFYIGVDNVFDEDYQIKEAYPIPGRTYKGGVKFWF